MKLGNMPFMFAAHCCTEEELAGVAKVSCAVAKAKVRPAKQD